jgi:hypothetical protein
MQVLFNVAVSWDADVKTAPLTAFLTAHFNEHTSLYDLHSDR